MKKNKKKYSIMNGGSIFYARELQPLSPKIQLQRLYILAEYHRSVNRFTSLHSHCFSS